MSDGAGPVESAIRSTVHDGQVFHTASQGKPFVVGEVGDRGLVLVLGQKGVGRVMLPWACLELVPAYVAAMGGVVKAGGANSKQGEMGTLDGLLKNFTSVNVARWLVVVLAHAGVGRVIEDRPLRYTVG